MKQTEDDKAIDIFDERQQQDLEEAHYIHTMNAFVELIVVYGWDRVTTDLVKTMGKKTW